MRLLLATVAILGTVGALLSGALGCAKLAGNSSSSAAANAQNAATGPVVAAPAEPSPRVHITSPARAAFLSTGAVAVTGRVQGVGGTPVSSVSLMGQSVPLDAQGGFRGMVTLVEGLNVIEATCIDANGKTGSTLVGVVGGDFQPLSQPISRAAVARLNESSFDGLAKVAEAGLWATDWTEVFKGLNPIFDQSFIGFIKVWINIEQVRFRDLRGAFDGRTTGLMTNLTIDAPIIDVTIVVDFGITRTAPIAAVASASTAVIQGDLKLNAGPQGEVLSQIQNTSTALNDFQLSVNSSLVDAAVQLLAKNAIRNALVNYINGALSGKLTRTIDEALADVLQKQLPWTILGKPYGVDVRAEQLTFDDRGISIAAGFNSIPGGIMPQLTGRAAAAPGSLVTAGGAPSLTTQRGFLVSVDDDAVNRAFFGLWAAGIMDVEMDDTFLAQNNLTLPIRLEAGQLRRFLPEIGGVVPDRSPLKIHLHAELPPVARMTGTPDIATLQAGEVGFDVYVDRGAGWEKLLGAMAQVEVGATVGLTNQGLRITSLSQPHFRFDVTDEPIVELDDRRLEVMLAVVLSPVVPHALNSMNMIGIPHLNQLQTVNVDVFRDGPALEHLSVTGDLMR